MNHLSSGNLPNHNILKRHVFLGELEDTKRSLTHKKKEMRQLMERMKRLEDTQARQNRERRWEPRRDTRHYMHHGSQKEEENWRVQNYEVRRHHQQPKKTYFPFVKLPSFSGESNPNLYLGWEDKVGQFVNVYQVEEDQKVN